MANPSLSEYLAQSQRGLYNSVFGPEYLQKQTYFTVDTATGIFNSTYGRKVWQAGRGLGRAQSGRTTLCAHHLNRRSRKKVQRLY